MHCYTVSPVRPPVPCLDICGSTIHITQNIFCHKLLSFLIDPLIRIFSDNFKIAHNCPIHKDKVSKSDPDNYRPTSVLSVVERLFENLCMTSY